MNSDPTGLKTHNDSKSRQRNCGVSEGWLEELHYSPPDTDKLSFMLNCQVDGQPVESGLSDAGSTLSPTDKLWSAPASGAGMSLCLPRSSPVTITENVVPDELVSVRSMRPFDSRSNSWRQTKSPRPVPVDLVV